MYYLKHLNNNINGIGLESDPVENKFTKQLGLNVVSKFIDTEHEDTEITRLLECTDIVSFFNVLEHIERPRKYIKYLSDSMKSGSFMVIEVPKHPSLASFANLTSCDNIYRHIVTPIHLQIFSEKSLRLLLEKDFDVVATWEFGQGFTDVINNAMILSGKENSDLYTKIMGIQNELQMAVDRAGFSDQILIIAKKK